MKKMMRRVLFAVISLCGLVLAGTVLGCNTPPAQGVTEEDEVWVLLAQGENDKARRYFLSEVEANARDKSGRAPLHIVAENKDWQMAAFFIALGADPNALDSQDRNPLDISAELSDSQTAQVLAEAGANVHYSPGEIESPAQKGIREGGNFLDALLNPRSLSSSDAGGRTFLHLAAESGNASITSKILAAGKNDLYRKDNGGKSALDIALEKTDEKKYAETAETLILAGAVSANPLYDYFAPAVRSSNYSIRCADGMTPLHYLARMGYTGYIGFVLEKNADVNIKNASGATPLHEAARSGNIEVMRTILSSGAEIKSQDAKGNSVLHIAVPPESHQAAAELFLDWGADPSVRDEHGDSPLHIAILLNRPPQFIRTLLEAGSDVTIRNREGKTPLYLAIQEERISVISLLLEYNSDVFAADNFGISLFERALLAGYPILNMMINSETVFHNDSQGNTMLHIAVRSRADTNVINHILDSGAKVNVRNKEGNTALHLAVMLNEESLGELLLNRGADIFAPNALGESPLFVTFPKTGRSPEELRRWMLNPQTLETRDGLGNTALHYMAYWQFDQWIPQAIRSGANTESPNATGETPLFIAVKNNAPGTIAVLAANGAVRDARDTLGNSALHAAVRWDAPRAAEALLVLGLDVNAHALNGKTPLHDSIRLGAPALERILLSRGAGLETRDADGNTPFMEAVLAGSPAAMKRLADQGAITSTRNFRGDTPLHIAAVINRSDISLLLLEWGASIHARNSQGRTPLHNALLTSASAVSALLAGDRIHQGDDYGNSPLHIAVEENSSFTILRMMVDLGARTDALDSEGRTPLRLAVDLKNWDAAKFLADAGSDVFISARDGKSPVELALSDTRGVQALFTGRAIGTKDNAGNTVLHYAARNGNTVVIQQLMELGANKELRNIALERPSDIALRWRHNEAAALLN